MTTKYHTLRPWLDEILTAIKRDIKNDYLPGDPAFCKASFGNRPLNRLTPEEINAAFVKELLQGNEEMDQWVVNHWVFKHGDVYDHFAERLSKINEDFDAIEKLTLAESEAILAGAVESFGAKPVYLFSVLNGVVFPEEVVARLQKLAEESAVREKKEAAIAAEQLELNKLKEHYQRELARLNEKYDAKVAGVVKKYTLETEALKKQVRALQLKLNGLTK